MVARRSASSRLFTPGKVPALTGDQSCPVSACPPFRIVRPGCAGCCFCSSPFCWPRGVTGLPPRGERSDQERQGAADRAADPAAGPEHRPDVGQPSFTQSYERSSVYPKMNAYILKWIVDIGDKVKKGDVLATLFVPELVADHETKKATVVLDRERIALAKESWRWPRPMSLRPRRGSRRPGRTSPPARGRGRAPGLGDQAARNRARARRGQSPGCRSRPPIGGRRPSRCGTPRRRPS